MTDTDWRRLPLWVDGKPVPLYRIARALGLSCRQTLTRYNRRATPVTMESLRSDGRKQGGPVRQAGWERTRNHEKRDRVRALLAEGKTQSEIARTLEVSRQAVSQLVKKLKPQDVAA